MDEISKAPPPLPQIVRCRIRFHLAFGLPRGFLKTVYALSVSKFIIRPASYIFLGTLDFQTPADYAVTRKRGQLLCPYEIVWSKLIVFLVRRVP